MAVKLHRCPVTVLKIKSHGCWTVEQALKEKGIDYEVVKEPLLKGRRKEVQAKTGQATVPVLELEDGRWIREEGADLAAKIQAGELP
jgi:glutathione S-transferase